MGFLKKIYKFLILLFFWIVASVRILTGQAVPGMEENIPFLVTFGKQGITSWGDDDFYQVFFFSIPKDYTQQFYIRVFDPDVGGEHDEIQGEFNSRTPFRFTEVKGLTLSRMRTQRDYITG
jgi:hypothetical protein